MRRLANGPLEEYYAHDMNRSLAPFALASTVVLAGAAVVAQPAPAPPKQEFVWPERIANAQVLPADIGSERLRQTMVGFARALGVRCTFCHVGPEGAPLTQLDFVSDANSHKNIARGMIRMVRRLNAEDLPAILGPAPAEPRVTCSTCHRGATTPETALPPPPPRPAAPPPASPSGERGL